MSIKRIIFLSQDRFSERNYQRFGFQLLIERGFKVEFWECTPFMFPDFFKGYAPKDIPDFQGVKLFYSEKNLLDSINRLTIQDVIINMLGSHSIKNWKIFKRVLKCKILWGSYWLGGTPPARKGREGKNFLFRVEKFFRRPITLFDYFLRKVPTKWFRLHPFKFFIMGGFATIPPIYSGFIDSNTDILDAHAFDYDSYLESKKHGGLEEAIVFLDQGGPLHPDRIKTKNSFPCSKEEYFGSLNSFFRVVEEKFSCQVIIAAHPKSDYSKMPDIFNGRKILYTQTNSLVKNSMFVLASWSTAINFAVLYKKPIIFLAINPPLKHFLDSKISCLASEFGKTPIHWTGKESIDWANELKVNEELYSKYLATYIKKPGSPEKLTWQIFADYLDNLGTREKSPN